MGSEILRPYEAKETVEVILTPEGEGINEDKNG